MGHFLIEKKTVEISNIFFDDGTIFITPTV